MISPAIIEERKLEILEDLRRVEEIKPGFTSNEYSSLGRFSPETLRKRFGSFNRAKKKAGINGSASGARKGFTPYHRANPADDDESGPRICLKCDRVFKSEHIKNIRLCDPCKGTVDYQDNVPVYGIG